MARITLAAIAVLLAVGGAPTVHPQAVPSQSVSPQRADGPLALINVNIIPMDHDEILSGRTVVIAGGRIAAIGAWGDVTVPANATRIDGGGRLYVIPGLADMHVHLRYEEDLRLLLASGVTLVRNMSGAPAHLEMRRRVADGTLLGPRIVTAGPQLRGEADSGATPAGAKTVVEAQAAAGYDFIKPYDGLPKDSYQAAVAAAAAHRMPVAGHVPSEVGVLGVLAAHQASIEHAEQIVYHYFDRSLDAARLPAIARAIADAHTYLTPTLATIRQLELQWEDPGSVLARPEIKFVNPETYAWWRTERGHDSSANRRMEPFLQQMVRVFRDHGVRMLAGTDYYLFGLMPGFGLHRELQALVEAGLTPYQALETATRNPAEFLGAGEAGTVAVGKSANLVVLDANPLIDIRNTTRRTGVVVRGRWLPAAQLDEWLESLSASFAAEVQLVDEALAPGGGVRIRERSDDKIPAFQRSTLALVGDALLSAKRFDDAVGVCELLARRYAAVPTSYTRLGDAYAGTGQRQDAVRAYETAIRLGAPMAEAIRQKITQLTGK